MALAKQFGPLDPGLRKATGAPTRLRYEELIDIAQRGARWRGGAERGPRSDRPARQPALALRQLVPGSAGEVLDAFRGDVPAAGGETELPTCARLGTRCLPRPQASGGRPAGAALRVPLAHSARRRGTTRAESASRRWAPARAPASRLGPQGAVPRVHCDRVAHDVPEGRLLLAELLEHATQPNSSTATSGGPATT